MATEMPETLVPPLPAPTLRLFSAEDLPWLVEQHRLRYAIDEGFDDTFGQLVLVSATAFIAQRDPVRESAWIAWIGDQRVGSIFCFQTEEPRTSRLRMFFVCPTHRRTGIGTLLLARCVEFARHLKNTRIILSTYSAHHAACALYAQAGFVCTGSTPDVAFGRELTELRWELQLHPAAEQ